MTTILVTHDQIEATSMADRIICMSRGRIEQIGTADDLYQRPDSLFVAGFIGSPPINLLPGEAQAGGIRVGEAMLPIPTATTGKVVVGIRPEHVRLGRGPIPGPDRGSRAAWPGDHLPSVDPLGPVRALEPGSVARFKIGEPVSAGIVSSLVFDSSTGRRIDGDEPRIAA